MSLALFGNTDPGVVDSESDDHVITGFVLLRYAQDDFSLLRKLDGVTHQIGQHLPQSSSSSKDRRSEEIARIKSPDGIVDAVLVRSSYAAFGSSDYDVYLCPDGVKFEKDGIFFRHEDSLFGAEDVKGLELQWGEPRLLEIRYAKAEIAHFRNIWSERMGQNQGYIVELQLAPSEPYSLPESDRQ